MQKDYYQILGVERKASKDEIKKAFHKLAHKYHPDKKGGDEARFKEVNEAYQVLSNEKKRSEYDTYGQVFSDGSGPQQGGGFQGFDPSQFGDFDFSNAGGFGDIFSEIFGGGRGGAQGRRGSDISIEITVNFSESIFGTTRKVLITKRALCEICKGNGEKPGTKRKKCETCNGQGKVRETKKSFIGVFTSVRECDACAGAGTIPEEKCSNCKGHGVMRKQEEISIHVPAGIENGEMIRLSGMGEAVQRGIAGDLYVKISVLPHSFLKREGNNLTMNLDIKLTEALLGGERSLETLDGKIDLVIPEGVNTGETLRLKGKGVPTGNNQRGDLLVKIKVALPHKLSKKARGIVETLRGEGM
jgi:molecular chaperone DnaJ